MKTEHIEPHKLGAVSLDHTQDTKVVVKDLSEFQNAIAQAQLDHQDFIEVDQKVFNYFTQNKSKFFYYGNPGIRVYLAGTREQIESEDQRIIL